MQAEDTHTHTLTNAYAHRHGKKKEQILRKKQASRSRISSVFDRSRITDRCGTVGLLLEESLPAARYNLQQQHQSRPERLTSPSSATAAPNLTPDWLPGSRDGPPLGAPCWASRSQEDLANDSPRKPQSSPT